MPNYYEVLQITSDATPGEIETAYEVRYNYWRRLVTHHDPDVVNRAKQALRWLKQVHDTLADPDKRAAYDATLDLDKTVSGLADPQARSTRSPTSVPSAPPPPKATQAASTATSATRLDAWICPKCNAASPVGTRYCRECGNEIGRDCPKCGELIEKTIRFCPECGVEVEAYIEEKKHEAESMLLRQQQEPRRQLEKHTQREAHARGRQQGRTRTIIYALGAILALGLIAVLVFSAAQIIQVRQSYTRATATVEQQYTNATVTLEPQQASATATIEAILASGGRVDEQGKVMVYVPAGEFQMGDEEFAKPVHTVILDAFWIDRTEVTNAQYQECVDAGVCDPPEHHVFIFEITPDLAGELDQNIIPDNLREKFEEHNRTLTPHARMKAQKSASNFIIVDFNREYIIKRETWLREPMIGVYVLVEEDCINSPNYSVVGVDWYDANTYCEWADKQLPTEAQWEYAARGPESFIYPWGNEWREKAASCQDGEMRRHTCNDGYEHIAPVGSLPEGASWVGALDMSGNVEEWVFDWLDDYSPETQINPTGPVTGTVKITRGGSYQRGGLMLNAVDRRPTLPENSSLVSGFRCAAPASEP